MTTTRGSAHDAGLLPVSVRLTNERLPNGQPSLRKRAARALSSLIAFFTGVTATLAWWSYGDMTRQTIANSYPQLGWLTPRDEVAVQKAPDTIAPAGSPAPHPDQRQLDAMLGDDLHTVRLDLDRIAASQELITHSIDEIATRIAAGQELITRSIEEIATSIAAGQEPTTLRTDQAAATVTAGQGQMAGNTDQTTSSVDQAPLAKASSITVESRGDTASLQPMPSLNIKTTEAKPPQTSSERGKQLPPASGYDASCFPSASAVLQSHPGARPSWTLRARGHEGTRCWFAASGEPRPTTTEVR
jgi:hypothetical protein